VPFGEKALLRIIAENRKSCMNKLLNALLLALVLGTSTGCVVETLVGGAIYNSTAKKEAYSKYVTESQKNNTDREVKGLKPLPVMSYEQWEKGQGDSVDEKSKK